MEAEKPLMLKEYLELDSNTDFISRFDYYAAPIRHLLEAELYSGGKLVRTRSKKALSKISSMIKLDFLLFSCSPGFNQRKRGNKDKSQQSKVRVKDIVRLKSFDLPPSPVLSISTSDWSESGESCESDFLQSSIGSSEFHSEIKAGATPGGNEGSPGSPRTTVSQENKVEEEEEEKEQLSPVAVMDFPYELEEEGESSSSPSFRESLANIERTKQELLQKIRRFECLAELDPIDLDEQFSAVDVESSGHVASDDEDEEEEEITAERQAWRLLSLTKTRSSAGIPDRCFDKLLVDFFTEGLSCTDERRERLEEKLLGAASEWINGGGCFWDRQDHRGEMEIREMDRNGRWRCSGEEERELGVDLERGIWGFLVDELVRDIVVC